MTNYTYTDSYKLYINITKIKIKLKWYVATHNIILLHHIITITDILESCIFMIRHILWHLFTLENSSQLLHERILNISIDLF